MDSESPLWLYSPNCTLNVRSSNPILYALWRCTMKVHSESRRAFQMCGLKVRPESVLWMSTPSVQWYWSETSDIVCIGIWIQELMSFYYSEPYIRLWVDFGLIFDDWWTVPRIFEKFFFEKMNFGRCLFVLFIFRVYSIYLRLFIDMTFEMRVWLSTSSNLEKLSRPISSF